jgi:hypothetical protein
VDSLLRVDPKSVLLHSLAASVNVRLGSIAAARRHQAWLLANRGTDPAVLYHVACIASLTGDRAAALDYLGRAIDAGFDNPRALKLDSDLATIRSDPRFAALAARVN